MNEEKPKTRIRRTNEQVDKAISDALTTLAGQMPLARITVNQLIAEAGIEAPHSQARCRSPGLL